MPRSNSYESYNRISGSLRRSKHSEEPSFHRKSSLEDNRSLYGKRKYNILKKANILYCETTEVVMRRMLMIVEEEIFKADSQNIQICGIKNRLDEAFGPNWNCFMARSGCWALKTYKPGTNLVFEYEGMMYDIFQAVDSTQNVHTKGSTGYLVYS